MWHTTTTVVPLEWKRYKDRLRASGWNSDSSLIFIIDVIADEMFDQYIEANGYACDDSEQTWWDIYELAEQAADELDGEW